LAGYVQKLGVMLRRTQLREALALPFGEVFNRIAAGAELHEMKLRHRNRFPDTIVHRNLFKNDLRSRKAGSSLESPLRNRKFGIRHD
jgi:hypothetical protein